MVCHSGARISANPESRNHSFRIPGSLVSLAPRNDNYASNAITLRRVLPAFIIDSSLRCDEQFANLSHADGAFAEQMAGDRALRGIFREPERIVRRKPVIDHQARQQ